MAVTRKTNRDEPSEPTSREKTLFLTAVVGLVALCITVLVVIWIFTQSVHAAAIVAVVMILCGGRAITAIAFGMDRYRRGRFLIATQTQLQSPSVDNRLAALLSMEVFAIDNVKIIAGVEKHGLTPTLAAMARRDIEQHIIPIVARATFDVSGIVRTEATRIIDRIDSAMNGR